jgi:hypothetical protein
MLPRDTKRRREQAEASNQTRLDSHLKERPVREMMIPYSDQSFREAAIEWLVATDQVRVGSI